MDLTVLLALVKGFGTSCGLIIAIGAQNAFVLKQGILKSHVKIVALICALIDATFITIGVGGIGKITQMWPQLLIIAKYGGILFLFIYGIISFKSAFSKKEAVELSKFKKIDSLTKTIITTFAISILNPHLYLDTIILLGSIASHYEDNLRWWFALGAIVASFSWFSLLALGSGYLTPLFSNPKAWQILNFFVGVNMWVIAGSLFLVN